MSLIVITGAPTSGKTAVAEQLIERGFEALETDDPHHTGIAGWHSVETGEYVAGFNQLDISDPDTLNAHIWRFTDGTLDRLKQDSVDKNIYLCGVLRDPADLVKAADKIIFLTTNEETIRHRFTLPREVDWGKEQWQIEKSIARNVELEQQYRDIGALFVDSVRPLDEVVEEVVSLTS